MEQKRYRFKLGKTVLVLIIIFCAASLTGAGFAVRALVRAQQAADLFASVFLLCFLTFFIVTSGFLLLGSSYAVGKDRLVIRTAYFKDTVLFARIERIMHFASENQLFLKLVNPDKEDIIRIHIRTEEVYRFVADLRKAAPEVPYEVTLPMGGEQDK